MPKRAIVAGDLRQKAGHLAANLRVEVLQRFIEPAEMADVAIWATSRRRRIVRLMPSPVLNESYGNGCPFTVLVMFRSHHRQGGETPQVSLDRGILMATNGEISWPSAGKSHGHLRGIPTGR